MNKSKYHNHKKVYLIFLTVIAVVTAAYFYSAEKREAYLSNLVKYHTKMIKSGSISSLVELGKMYEKGEGVKKDLSKAQELFKKAINFNKYLDEIYPAYSEYDSSEETDDTSSTNSIDKDTQLKNIISSVKQSQNKSKTANTKTTTTLTYKAKYIPYNKTNKSTKTKSKNPFKSVIVLEKNVLKKPIKKSITKKTIVLRDSSKNTRKISITSPRTQKRTKAKKTTKKSKTVTRNKKTKLKTKKISSPTKKVAYKKTTIIKVTPKKPKPRKQKLQAKRSPTLYEARPDYETELGIFDDEELNDTDEGEIITVREELAEEQTAGSNFTSNPCETASAKYIAKCRRYNRKK